NSVTITGSTVDGGVHGGRAVSGAVQNNTVKITDAKLTNANLAYGGSFLMSGGGIVGGFTKYGNAADNSVSITNTTIGGDMAVVSGAYSEGDSYSEAGSAVARNTVILNKVTSTGVLAVAGAISDKATVGGESDGTAEKGNQVSITDSKVASVRGGISKLGDAKNNAVIIDGGTVTGDSVVVDGRIVVNGGVYGGQSNNASATGNTVKITNGADVKTNVYGGFAMNATGNAVEISGNGTTVEKDVYGGYIGLGGEYTGKTVTSNTVTLGGVSVGGSVYGGKVGYGKSDVVTDNKLILSAVGNTVGSDVQNFQTIELADTVAWSNGATVLAANAFKENNDTNKPRAGLDISAVQEAFGNETSGKMILLASNTADDFKTLSLTTTDGTDTLDENTQSKFLKQGASTTDAGVNGVTITSASTHSVTLDKANSYKNVLYTISGLASNVTLGNMTWGTPRDVSGDGLEFNATTAIDASGLTFSGTDTTLLKEGSTKTLVKGAVGITGNDIKQPGENKGTVAVEYTDTNNITFNATAKGTVGVDTNDVKYTVGSVTADKITLAEKVWGSAADNLPDSSWSASASTQIDATNFAYTGSANDALEAGVTETVINAKGLTKSSPVIEGTGKTVGVDVTDDNGINLIATATGHVAADKDKANYVVDSVALDTVNLGGWNGTGTSQVTATWTGTDVTVNTGKFALPTDMEAGESRDILTASATGFFSQGNISGDREYKEGSAFEPDTQNGVTLTGNQVGGVKAEDSGKKLTYYAMMKAAKTLTLGEVGAFEADGTMATYGKGYDLTQAEISKDDLKFFDGITQAKKGESMTLVDATGATKNANGEALKAYADTYTVGYGEDVDGKALELEVTREDIIATNDKKTKLTYTVGDKTINTVAFTGAVAWDTEGAYYTNTQDTFNAD
ncbi:MAG: hypothetical protein J5492_05430, partial [Oxalobacter sp.]|nr:hypothetical protein [Oxalobacter sp.]